MIFSFEFDTPLGVMKAEAGENGIVSLGFNSAEMPSDVQRPETDDITEAVFIDGLSVPTLSDEFIIGKATKTETDAGKDISVRKTGKILVQLVRQLDEYFRKERFSFSIPLDLAGTPFQLKVWQQLSEIPYGKIVTYKEQAVLCGNAGAVRAVAGADGANPAAIIVPCHRVVGSDGSLTGYAGGLWRKKLLLELENGGLRC